MQVTISTMSSDVLKAFATSHQAVRVSFAPDCTSHREAFQHFLKTGKWFGGCPFKLEWPFVSVPALCQSKLLDYYLSHDVHLNK
jgi:hypothetical protein